VPPLAGTLAVDGLSAPVRVGRDRWGVPHIVAATADDLFFAQGFVQAEDRLFQMDLWRRSVQGRLAEVLGSNFVDRDAMTRRIQYRGNPDEEWQSYQADTRAIATAFVRGINAWVAIAREHPPEEFVLAGWRPEFWRPEDLLNRTDAFLASSGGLAEVFRARLVAALGAPRASALLAADAPAVIPPDVDQTTVKFPVGDALREVGTAPFFTALAAPVERGVGSNAWVVSARRSATGAPVLATDPHRLFTNPSLRYLIHLTAPGWNVIGATAPWLPGVAIGHNDRVAWGMTSFDADVEDLYVERLNPDNRHQIEVGGQWHNTAVVVESLWIKGRRAPVTFEREYTPHGVVIAVDDEKHLAFTLRWSGAEPGTAGELAALSLDRAASGAGLRAALAQWKMPAVDVVYADAGGAIGSQVAALVPVRRGWDGRLPAAGWTGRAEWKGWRTLDQLPHAADPAEGYLALANRNRARTQRLRAAFAAARTLTLEDSSRLQHDVLAWNAERLVPLLAGSRAPREDVERARQRLLAWNRQVSIDSTEATIYVTWERLARRMLVESRIPGALVDEFLTRADDLFAPALTEPSHLWFDGDPVRARDALVLRALTSAVDDLKNRPGGVDGDQRWGRLHTAIFSHVLSATEAARRRFNIGPFARAGYADTLMSTAGPTFEAAAGASFSAIFDVADWDRSLAQNAPGQSESPGASHFADLAGLWAAGGYFPLAFSDTDVTTNAESRLVLVPKEK